MEIFSLADSGTQTLDEGDEYDGSWSLAGESDQFEVEDSLAASYGFWASESFEEGAEANSVTASTTSSQGYTMDDAGEDSLSGSTSNSSDSYTLSDSHYLSDTIVGAGSGTFAFNNESGEQSSYSFDADGTDSFGPGDEDQSSMTFDEQTFVTDWGEASDSVGYNSVGDSDIHSTNSLVESQSMHTWGWSTENDGISTVSYEIVTTGFFSGATNESYVPGVGSTYASSTEGTSDDTTVDGTIDDHTSTYSTVSGSPAGFSASVPGLGLTIPEDAVYGDVLYDIQSVGKTTDYLGLSEFKLYDTYRGDGVIVPHSVPANLMAPASSLGQAPLGIHPTLNGFFGFTPSTNAMTAHGLPNEEASDLANLAQNNGPTDGVSNTATVPPTSVLVALAAAGRNPTDTLIPTQAGTEGSDDEEDDDEDVAAGTSSASASSATGMAAQPMDDGGGETNGSHLEGPSMRAAPPEGMLAGAWSSLKNTVTEFFTRDAALQVEQATDPLEKLDAQSRNTVFNKLYHHVVKQGAIGAYELADAFAQWAHDPFTPGLEIGEELASAMSDPNDAYDAICGSAADLIKWYNGLSEWEKSDLKVRIVGKAAAAVATGRILGEIEAAETAAVAPAATPTAGAVAPKITLQHRSFGTNQVISAGIESKTGIRFSTSGEKMFVDMWEVAPELQKQGVGRLLFQEALAANPEVTSIRGVAELDNLAALRATGDVAQTPFAQALKKLGFTEFYAENSLGQRITDFSNIKGEVVIGALK